jgi:cytochrome P450
MFSIQQVFSKIGLGGNGLQVMLDFSEQQVKERQESLKDVEQKPVLSDDFLAKVLARHEENPDSFSMADVLDACATNIIAGSDTTAISLTAIVWFLMKYPQSLLRVRNLLNLEFGHETDHLAAEGRGGFQDRGRGKICALVVQRYASDAVSSSCDQGSNEIALPHRAINGSHCP